MTRHHLYKGASTEIRVMNSSSLTLSHVRPSLSTNILISSGMAREGWVSLSWMATYQVQHTHITLLDSIPTILDKSPRDSNALFIISRFAHKNSASFLKFSCSSPSPPPYTKLKLAKNFRIHTSNIVCGVWGGVGHVWIEECPKKASLKCHVSNPIPWEGGAGKRDVWIPSGIKLFADVTYFYKYGRYFLIGYYLSKNFLLLAERTREIIPFEIVLTG